MEKKISKEIYQYFSNLDVSGLIETKGKLSYLSWGNIVKLLNEAPYEWSYEIEKFEDKPWFFDKGLGYFVKVSLTVEGLTRTMVLPFMDDSNYAVKEEEYQFKVGKGEYERTHIVPSADMRDFNDTVMRCFVKAAALFGLGLSLYIKEGGAPIPKREWNNKKVEVPELSDDDKAKILKWIETNNIPVADGKDGEKIVWDSSLRKAGLSEEVLSKLEKRLAAVGILYRAAKGTEKLLDKYK